MTARRVTKHFFTMVFIAAAMLAIVFTFDSAQVFAENKPLEKGQIFRVGNCTTPGKGYGPNGGYELNAGGDTFTYNGEWYYGNSDTTYAQRIEGKEYDEDEFYKEPVNIAYPAKVRNYGGHAGDGAWGSLHDSILDTPDACCTTYYAGDGKYVDAYIFYLISGKYYKYPMTIYCTAVAQGDPWGVQIISGDGTHEHPFRFAVLFGEPYDVKYKVGEHGDAYVKPVASAGEVVKIEKLRADVGYVVDKIVVRSDDGTEIKETEVKPAVEGDYDSYFFTMPEGNVTVDISFKEKDGIISVVSSDGSTEHFSSFEKALPKWKDGTTLRLNDGIRFDGPVTITDNRILDLNGYVLKTDGKAFIIKYGGSLTVNDSNSGRWTTFEGKGRSGGWILGSVSGRDAEDKDYVTEGVIDVAKGSFTMNGGSLVNEYGDNFKWGLSATTGAHITLNDGYIKATKVAIVDSKKDVSIKINGGRYELESSWAIQSEVPDITGKTSEHSMVSVTGGYYEGWVGMMDEYPGIAEGYQVEIKREQIDWQWPNYKYRITDGRQALRITTTENIENGSVKTANPYAKPGDTVTLTASPAEHYRVKSYIVTDADGNEVEVKDGKFTMPESAVTINAVFEPITVNKIRLNKVRVTLNEVGTYKLNAATFPADALNKDVTWSSSDENVATVDADGNVKAVGVGKAKITAASADGGDTVVCTVTVKHQHHLVKTEAKEANCQKEGNIEYWVCKDDDHACGKIYADEKGENEIALSDTVIPVNADNHKEYISKTQTLHARTCTDPLEQVDITYCPACAAVVNMTRHGEAAYGHDWGNWETDIIATEEDSGTEKRVCNRCGKEEVRGVPAGNQGEHKHDLTKVEAIPATCTEPGNIEYWVCKDEACKGHVFADSEGTIELDPDEVIVYPSGHTEGEEVRENERTATCDAPVVYDLVLHCKDCGEEIRRAETAEGSALGHDWSDWEMADEKTHQRVCKRDSSHIDTAKHNWDDGYVIAPTCKEKGKTVYTCMTCGYSEERDFTEPDPSEHVLGEFVQENRVNATKDQIGGYDLVRRCELCGEVVVRTHVEIPKLEKDEYNIDIKTKVEGSDNKTGGTVSGGKDKGKKGDKYRLTQKPSSGFEFLYWLIGGKKYTDKYYDLDVNDAAADNDTITVEAVFGIAELPYDGGIFLKAGETYELGYELYPSGSMPYGMKWRSSDNSVATVNGIGDITAAAAGKADITGELRDGTVTVTYTVTVEGDKAAEPSADTSVGTSHDVSGSTYQVLSADTVTLTKAKNAKTVTVPATVKIGGKTFKVTKIGAQAFKGSKATKLIVKTKKLTKKSVKGSLKGSKIKTVKVKVGKKSVNKKYVKKYKKIFTKKNAGRKVTVK